jgi:uncharacterized protein (TIGR02147 family)
MYSTNVEILKYDNYRSYLKDAVEDLRSQKIFSYRKFSHAAGFTSPNFLLLLIQGERNLSQASADKLGTAFGLKNIKLQFFKELVQFNQSTNPSERFEKMQNLLKVKAKLSVHFIEDDTAEYLSQWIHSAIRELLIVSPYITEDEISQRLSPHIKIQEVKKSLNLLLKLNLIQQTEQGYQTTSTSLSTGHEFVSASAFAYHDQMIQLGKESLQRFPRHQRNITGTTLSLSWENFQIIQKKIQDLRSEILAMSEIDQNKEEVFQFNFQLFPLTLKK